jgi:hypothetical protein
MMVDLECSATTDCSSATTAGTRDELVDVVTLRVSAAQQLLRWTKWGGSGKQQPA